MTRNLLAAVVATASLCAVALPAAAQGYPSKPVRLVVPFPPGGGTDFFARTVGAMMSDTLGQPVVVDNRPGGSTIIGAENVKTSPPDGYTVLLGDLGTYALNPSLFKKLPYDPATDFAPVTLTGRFVLAIAVNPAALNVNSIQEFIDAAKKAPGKIAYASPGTGSPHQLAMELFAREAGIKLLHVPYKGAAPALQDLIGGQVPVMMVDLAAGQASIKGGKIKVLGTATPSPVAALPGVPTIASAGLPGFEAWAWQGFSVPKGTQPEVISRLREGYVQAIADPAVRAKLVEAGIEPLQSTPQEMASYVSAETAKWSKVIRDANISLD
ncbi:MAG: tripartite tricarboxylate transporter substrate binding protein [Burkholderiales bacterium]